MCVINKHKCLIYVDVHNITVEQQLSYYVVMQDKCKTMNQQLERKEKGVCKSCFTSVNEKTKTSSKYYMCKVLLLLAIANILNIIYSSI